MRSPFGAGAAENTAGTGETVDEDGEEGGEPSWGLAIVRLRDRRRRVARWEGRRIMSRVLRNALRSSSVVMPDESEQNTFQNPRPFADQGVT